MPNNPIRFKKGYNPTLAGTRRMKRHDVASSVNVINKSAAAAGLERGSPNGGPSPVFAGGTGTGGTDASNTVLP